MNLSPLDIRKHEFRKTFRGYDTEEVTGFLEMVGSEFETIIREASQLKERTSWLKDQLDSYHDLENTLRETLISAQRAYEMNSKAISTTDQMLSFVTQQL